ncbi:MAG: hydantoinase/oxoprolinase family protein [Pseudomonadota bacterium]
MTVRFSADIGGTFTDVVLQVRDALFSAKTLTTYSAPDQAIVTGLQEVCAQAQVAPESIAEVIHGTTLATNALIERKGAKTAFITTAGFRDVIEMRTESRFEQYDLNLTLPKPLVARQHRYPIAERIGADGQVLLPLDTAALAPLVETLQAGNYDSIAVGLMHAYANPAHERAVGEMLKAVLPDVALSLSSDVSPQVREYERFNTVVANAYIKPLMKGYLLRLRASLASAGVSCPVYLMHSGGGIISLQSAAEFPVRLVESGPAGGAIFAANIAQRHGIDKALSFDMGGTTAKICLINGGTPSTSRVFEVARSYRFKKGSGMPISIPVIDMVEIGAGGGSLARIDEMLQIRVGPESAASEPGPACYGHGGDRPAVTDADLVLGKLDPDHFAGGSITLDRGLAEAVLAEQIGTPLSMDATSAAHGVAEVVDESMANAARVHAVENGSELSDYTMIAFGGAAPLHAGRLCAKLGVNRLLVPPGAGVGSAIGFLWAPFSFEATRSVFMTIATFDTALAEKTFSALHAEAAAFVDQCQSGGRVDADYKVYMRYVGQGWEIPVSIPVTAARAPDARQFESLFEQTYAGLFGRVVAGAAIELTVWAVNVASVVAQPSMLDSVEDAGAAQITGHRDIFDTEQAQWLRACVVERAAIQPGQSIRGPAVVVENETSIVLQASQRARCHADGCIEVTNST